MEIDNKKTESIKMLHFKRVCTLQNGPKRISNRYSQSELFEIYFQFRFVVIFNRKFKPITVLGAFSSDSIFRPKCGIEIFLRTKMEIYPKEVEFD